MQSEIEESSLESLSKSRMQGVYPDRASGYTSGGHPDNISGQDAIVTSGCCRHYTRLPQPLHPAAPPFHPAAATFHPDILHPAHSIRIFCIRRMMPDGRGGRFKLLRIHISESAYSAYPNGRAAILHKCCGVLLKLPDICHRHFEIFCFRYFALDILCLNP